jgi:hypothetical protein
VQAEDESDATYAIERLAERSIDDELGATIDHDLMLLNFAIVGVGLYTFFAISRLRDGFVGMRLTLTARGATIQPSMQVPSTMVAVRVDHPIVKCPTLTDILQPHPSLVTGLACSPLGQVLSKLLLKARQHSMLLSGAICQHVEKSSQWTCSSNSNTSSVITRRHQQTGVQV